MKITTHLKSVVDVDIITEKAFYAAKARSRVAKVHTVSTKKIKRTIRSKFLAVGLYGSEEPGSSSSARLFVFICL